MKKITLLFTILVSITFAETINVAVNELKSHGIGETETAIISERVRSELINTGQFRVMERGQMNMILEEQGFQQSGVCSDASCLVEVGQILAVDRIITGSIGLIGSMYTLNLKMVNVENGEIEATSNVDYHGDIAGFLSQSIRVGVQRLNTKQGVVGVDASLSIFSSPEGADISINGKEIGITPLKDYLIRPGEISLIVSKRDYISADSLFYLGEAQRKSLTFSLMQNENASPKKNKVFKVLGFSVGGTMMAAGVIMGVQFNNAIEDKQKEYDELDGSDNPQRFTELRTDMDDAKLYRNISYVTAGCGAALVTVSFFF